jgi:murein DD-endopeptidase MepM/ murein hydrolase activator NlpD
LYHPEAMTRTSTPPLRPSTNRAVVTFMWVGLCLGACGYGELSGGSDPRGGRGLDPGGAGATPVDPTPQPPPEPPSLGPAAPSAPPAQPAQPAQPAEPSAPASSSGLTVTGIVGGAYSITQDYGPAQYDYGYAYCHSYGDWPAGQIIHCGVDIGLKRGRALFAPDNGTVSVAGGTGYYADAYNGAAGQLTLTLEDGAQVILGHSSEILVAKGQRVTRGQKVALSGQSSVNETNGHLHLEVRVRSGGGLRTVDPMIFFGP